MQTGERQREEGEQKRSGRLGKEKGKRKAGGAGCKERTFERTQEVKAENIEKEAKNNKAFDALTEGGKWY